MIIYKITSHLSENKIKSEKINELLDNLIEILADENKKVIYLNYILF